MFSFILLIGLYFSVGCFELNSIAQQQGTETAEEFLASHRSKTSPMEPNVITLICKGGVFLRNGPLWRKSGKKWVKNPLFLSLCAKARRAKQHGFGQPISVLRSTVHKPISDPPLPFYL
jgi:hypothetical protein